MTEQEMIDVIQAHIDGKPFECWVNVYANKVMAHTYKNDALGHSGDSFIRCAVHMREVKKEDE